MIPIGKFMHAEPIGCEPIEVYEICSRGKSILGYAEWYPGWQCYVFISEKDVALSHDCCLEMSRFLANLDREVRDGGTVSTPATVRDAL